MFLNKRNIIIIGCSLLCLASVTWGVKSAWDNRDGSCIATKPLIAKSGHISSGNGQNIGWTTYVLYYPGIYEHSGNECLKGFYVTKEEYSRRMYVH